MSKAITNNEVTEYLTQLLSDIRCRTRDLPVENDELPLDLTSVLVRWGTVGPNVVAGFYESETGHDQVLSCGEVGADVVVLLDVPDFQPIGSCLKRPRFHSTPKYKHVLVGGSSPKDEGVPVIMSPANAALFNCSMEHSCSFVVNNLALHLADPITKNVRAAAIVPFALYSHFEYFALSEHRSEMAHLAATQMNEYHDSPAGKRYQRIRASRRLLLLHKSTSVVVLGSFADDGKRELRHIRDYLGKKYNAALLDELPEVSQMSVGEKLGFWAAAARFCVVADCAPSGHISEYEQLVKNRVITAMLRPKGKGSTRMIGDEGLVDMNYVRVFEFENSPIEILEAATEWAESILTRRSEAYNAEYPWRADRVNKQI